MMRQRHSWGLLAGLLCLVASTTYAQQSSLPALPGNLPAPAPPSVTLPESPGATASAPVTAAPPTTAAVSPPGASVSPATSPTPPPGSAAAPSPEAASGAAGGPQAATPEKLAGEKEKTDKIDIPGFSFGDVQTSLLFTVKQIETMKTVLTSVESRTPDQAPSKAVDLDILPFVAPKPIEEPKPYPVFYLSSVFYHSPSDWAVWLSNKRLTPQTNQGEIAVAAISPDAVKFDWRPTYIRVLIKRQQENKFASAKAVRNKLTPQETASLDEKNGVITFTLKPNQSFDASRFSTFEGRMEPAADLPALQGLAIDNSTADKLSNAANAVLNDLAGTPATPPAANTEVSSPSPTQNTIGAAVGQLRELIKNPSSGFGASPDQSAAPPTSPPPAASPPTN